MEDTELKVDNEIYHSLGERWYSATDHPVALLRAEGRARNPWIRDRLCERLSGPVRRVLDVGCGAGFLSNYLASEGFEVTGLDASAESLAVARQHDTTGTVRYDSGDACRLPYADGCFDAACAMDFLEHVDQPERVISECSRVLRPGGLFFFATFQRTFIAWLIAIKGVEWFVKNTPDRLHQLEYFINARDLQEMCSQNGMTVSRILGSRPRLNLAFLRMLFTGEVKEDFSFRFTSLPLIGYIGEAVRS